MQTIILFKATPVQANQEDSFEAILQNEGFNVISIKTLDFHYENLEELKNHLQNADKFSGIVFSSPRCVSACFEALRGEDLPPGWMNKPHYCIGPSTASTVERLLHLTCKGSEAGNATSLASIILTRNPSEGAHLPFLYPRSNTARDTLKNALGDTLLDIIVYKTVTSRHLDNDIMNALKGPKVHVDFAVYFSPSGIEAMEKLHEKIQHLKLKVIAIGPTTAQALEKHNIPFSGICDEPTVASLLNVIRQLNRKETNC